MLVVVERAFLSWKHVRRVYIYELMRASRFNDFPSFFSKSILTPMVGLISHNLAVETHFYDTIWTFQLIRICMRRERVLLPAISTASRQGAVFDDLKTVDPEACQQRGLLENDRHHNATQHCEASSRSSSPCTSRATHSNCGLLTRRTSVNHWPGQRTGILLVVYKWFIQRVKLA